MSSWKDTINDSGREEIDFGGGSPASRGRGEKRSSIYTPTQRETDKKGKKDEKKETMINIDTGLLADKAVTAVVTGVASAMATKHMLGG